VSRRPHFGHTRRGLPVHAHVLDHLAAAPGASRYARVNAWLAVKITQAVGTMTCAYAFAAFDLIDLPYAIRQGVPGMVQWFAAFFLQLVLLSVIMVNQNIQSVASDARSAKTFEDCEDVKEALTVALDKLDEHTEGGIKAVLDAIAVLAARKDGS
jgi:hypothetical protein